ncbi:MAG: IS66 family transposase [Alphaproteobacteria bacterium]|nr:IS66 family transposase [Alphaproteobacteria bacterium]
MASAVDSLPDDVETLKALLIATRDERDQTAAELRQARAEADDAQAREKTLTLLIEKLKFQIAKLRHASYGQSAERHALIEQLELELAEAEETAAESKTTAELAAARERTVEVRPFQRRKPARRPLPEHLPRERVVEPPPTACPCCGGTKLRKIGEDVTETLEAVPRQWKVIQHVREKFSCRSCEKITQAPAPSHPVRRGRAGPNLLAMVLNGKYGLHLPLERQSKAFAHEGIELDVSTLADWVGACAATLAPLVEAIKAHVFAAERIHADDTTVKVLAKGKCRTGRFWDYVRDDRPFSGKAAPAVAFFYSPNRESRHPHTHLAGYQGLMQADAYAGFTALYELARKPGPIIEQACWAHARRAHFDLARLQKSPIAIEIIKRIDVLFAVEREINGQPSEHRRAMRQERSAPLVAELENYMREAYAKLSPKSDPAKAIAYSLNRWAALTRFLGDGRLCMTNNAAEREIRSVAVGRHNWTFVGSDEGGRRAAAMFTLINSCKLNGVDPQAWLAYVLANLPDHPASRIAELLPWNFKPPAIAVAA